MKETLGFIHEKKNEIYQKICFNSQTRVYGSALREQEEDFLMNSPLNYDMLRLISLLMESDLLSYLNKEEIFSSLTQDLLYFIEYSKFNRNILYSLNKIRG